MIHVRRILTRSLGIAAVAIALPGTAAPRFVEAPPLAEVLSGASVGDVRPGPIQVPIITWGGDIATVHGNGNAERTAAGSRFAAHKLDLVLVREDVFPKQVEAYLAGRSPYLRGTLAMVNMALGVAARDPRTQPVVIYQLTWSAGGDALVVKSDIAAAKDLRGKTIALQAYGPHVDYAAKILTDAGLTLADVRIRWLPDLTGTDDSPMAAFQTGEVDAAFVIIPDALALTSGGAVGTGAEGSVKGAKIMLSTRTANRIIADVYAVRADFFAARRAEVESFVRGLFESEEALRVLVKGKAARSAEYRETMSAAARLLLDSAQATADAEGLYGDAEFAGHRGNMDFFSNRDFPRGFERLTAEVQRAFVSLGLLASETPLAQAGWDYAALGKGLTGATAAAETARFDAGQVASVVARRQQQGTLAQGELFSFEIYFKPNQNTFAADLYQSAFDKVIDLAATYGGALITIEGHSDPMGYLRDKKDGKPEVVLGRVKQSARNLSLSRAVAVRDSVIEHAQAKSITLDPSQFAVVGHGISKTKSGVCGADPCAPKTEREWRDNMRVEFRILQIEAEADVFKPL